MQTLVWLVHLFSNCCTVRLFHASQEEDLVEPISEVLRFHDATNACAVIIIVDSELASTLVAGAVFVYLDLVAVKFSLILLLF